MKEVFEKGETRISFSSQERRGYIEGKLFGKDLYITGRPVHAVRKAFDFMKNDIDRFRGVKNINEITTVMANDPDFISGHATYGEQK